MKRIKNFKKGFTLIELLIVIAIIGILATLLMVNFVGVRQRARDAQRKSDLRQIQSALELYRSDQGSYPSVLPACGNPLQGGTSPNTVTYMQKVPCDPSPQGVYTYSSNANTSYSVYSCLENVNDPQKDPTNNPTYCAGGNTSRSYTVTNP